VRVYLAASSAELERYRAMLEALRSDGHDVWDWSAEHRPTAEMSAEDREIAACACLREMEAADAVVVLAPAVRSDALVEMGYALAYEMPLIVAGPLAQRGIFASFADAETESDVEALLVLRAWGGDEEARAALEARRPKNESPAAVGRPGLGQV